MQARFLDRAALVDGLHEAIGGGQMEFVYRRRHAPTRAGPRPAPARCPSCDSAMHELGYRQGMGFQYAVPQPASSIPLFLANEYRFSG